MTAPTTPDRLAGIELVTDEAIEKAGRAIWEHDNGHTTWPPRDPLEIGPAEDAARAALEAAAPLIAARALEEAAHHIRITDGYGSDWLRARAARLTTTTEETK